MVSYMKQFICGNQKALTMVQGVSADSSDHYMDKNNLEMCGMKNLQPQ